MQEGNDPSLGVNSWLEEELYHQYQFDRKSVDEGWTDLFVHAESANGNAATATAPVPEPAATAPPTTEVAKAAPSQPAKQDSKAVGASDQLIPLRGASKIAPHSFTLLTERNILSF